MRSRTISWAAAGALILAITLWGAFGYLTVKLSGQRVLYAAEVAEAGQQATRLEAANRLHTLVRDTRDEREILEDLARTDVLTAAETIEAVGKAAGAAVSVGSATAAPLNSTSRTHTDLRAVVMLVNAEGRLASLLRAASFFEALPFLSSVERLELEESPPAADGKKAVDLWRMTARIRIITTSQVGI